MTEKIKKNLFPSLFFLTIFWNKDKIKEIRGDQNANMGYSFSNGKKGK